MTLLQQIRTLRTVADCEAWRAKAGDLNSTESLAFIVRIAALRDYEAGLRQALP
jgi:hypothetical protein